MYLLLKITSLASSPPPDISNRRESAREREREKERERERERNNWPNTYNKVSRTMIIDKREGLLLH